MYQVTKETYGYAAPNAKPWYAYGLYSTETFTISNMDEFLNWLNQYFKEYGKDFFETATCEIDGSFVTEETVGIGNNAKTYTYILKEI
jgi:hypothetical protein